MQQPDHTEMNTVLIDDIQHVFISSGNVIIKFGSVTGNTDQSGRDELETSSTIAIPMDKFSDVLNNLIKASELLLPGRPNAIVEECHDEIKEHLGVGIVIRK